MKIQPAPDAVTKLLTGISGFDEITDGGLSKGRTTLVMGGPGCGKTVFALQALVNGARNREAAIFVAFEESVSQIVGNAAAFVWDLPAVQEGLPATIRGWNTGPEGRGLVDPGRCGAWK
ncbi:MAG TPA: ATPase domain-containing protein [Polyangiales bacterium]